MPTLLTDYEVVAATMHRVAGVRYDVANDLYLDIIEHAAVTHPEHTFNSGTRSIDCAIQRLRPDCGRYDEAYSTRVGYTLHSLRDGWAVLKDA